MKLKILMLCIIIFVGRIQADEKTQIKNDFDKILAKSKLNKNDFGLIVVDPKSDSIFYDLNSEKRLIPASITKLFTAAAILHELHPDYKFHTKLYIEGTQNGDTLEGKIYLKGGGDPAFVSERLWMLVNEFWREGIRKINGPIIVDDSYFDSERFDPGREPDRNDRAYDAPVSALSFNWNSTTIYVRPAKKSGLPAHVWIDPENDYVTLKNRVTTSGSGSDLQTTREKGSQGDVLIVGGHIGLGMTEKHIYKNISQPSLYAGYALISFLKQRGISVKSEIKEGVTPSSARLVVDFESLPLSKLVADMNKFSNNFVAEMLTKGMASEMTKKPGSMNLGLSLLKKYIEGVIGLKSGEYFLSNAAGFSRKNSFSAQQFSRLLSWVHKDFLIWPEFLQSLPIAGVDGTLEKRFKESSGVRWVRAKTGLLNGVVALAGYAGRPNDGVFAFTFMYNGRGDESHVRSTFDALAARLVK